MSTASQSQFVKHRHKFQAPEGARLCVWCGYPKEIWNKHIDLPDGWEPIATAPKYKKIEVYYITGKAFVAHWAEGGGEEQPYYKGWFRGVYNSEGKLDYYRGIDEPDGWRWIKDEQ